MTFIRAYFFKRLKGRILHLNPRVEEIFTDTEIRDAIVHPGDEPQTQGGDSASDALTREFWELHQYIVRSTSVLAANRLAMQASGKEFEAPFLASSCVILSLIKTALSRKSLALNVIRDRHRARRQNSAYTEINNEIVNFLPLNAQFVLF